MTLWKPDIRCSQNVIKANTKKETSHFENSQVDELLTLAKTSDKNRIRDMSGCAPLIGRDQLLKFTITKLIYQTTMRITILVNYYKTQGTRMKLDW